MQIKVIHLLLELIKIIRILSCSTIKHLKNYFWI
uniref:Uncharacterized protein n=1 Tax=Myoviridae sp. ctCo31 TaxID=2825053 RepID=A0A8S5UMC5_9CAUD|nr:MAG TPA: hypothetical protein [Myoviridae sp. ctCo31]